MHPCEGQMADTRLAPEAAQSPLQNGYASCNGSGKYLLTDQPQPKSPAEPRAETFSEPQPETNPEPVTDSKVEPKLQSEPKQGPRPETQLELQPPHKPVACGTAVTLAGGPRRSASDGAMRDVSAVGRRSPPASSTLERTRSHSDSDERVAMLRARIGRRFEQLEEDRQAALRSPCAAEGSSASSTPTEGPDTPTPLHDLCSPGDPCESLRWGSSCGPRPRSVSVAEVKELAYARLQAELSRAQQELKLKDEEVARLSQIRDEVGAELEELTASLFEEANNMVREANIKQAAAERRLQECSLKVDEVGAIWSCLETMFSPRSSLQYPSTENSNTHSNSTRTSSRSRTRKTQHDNSQTAAMLAIAEPENPTLTSIQLLYCVERGFRGYKSKPKQPIWWRLSSHRYRGGCFLAVNGRNRTNCVRNIKQRALWCPKFRSMLYINSMGQVSVRRKRPNNRTRPKYRHPKNRSATIIIYDGASSGMPRGLFFPQITSVCDLFCYLRYIQQGLVRNSIHEVYWEVIRRRRCIALARLGIGPSSS
ncbi:unnamed protein product [Ixodes hexagonus]